MVLSRRFLLSSATVGLSLANLANFNNLLVRAEKAAGDDSEDATETDEPEKPTDVKVLGEGNFKKVLAENHFVLVKWFAPWCGHCKAMKEDYIKAAKLVKEDQASDADGSLKKILESEGKKVAIAEVDATTDATLASEYEVQGYPTLHWFANGKKKLDYNGDRTAEGILEWIKQNVGPHLKEVSDAELAKMKKERSPGKAIFQFSGHKTDEEYMKIATAASELPLIASTFIHVEYPEKSLSLFKGTEEIETYPSDGKWDLESISKWITDNRRPLFGQINEDNFEIYMEHAKNGLFWVCIDPAKIKDHLHRFSQQLVPVAKKHLAAKGSDKAYPFVWLDVSEFEEHAKQELGCTTYPTLVLQRGDLLGEKGDAKVDKFVRSFSEDPHSLTEAAVEAFLTDIETGKLEPVPEPDELDQMDEETEEDGDDDDDGEVLSQADFVPGADFNPEEFEELGPHPEEPEEEGDVGKDDL